MNPLCMEFCVETWTPRDASIALKRCFHFFSELSIFSALLAEFSFPPSRESAHGSFQHVTHHRHWILPVVISDKLRLHSWLREKMLPAFFKMSRSCRTRSTSRLSWWFSSSR